MLLQPDLLKTKESEMEWLGVASAGGGGGVRPLGEDGTSRICFRLPESSA